MLKSKQIDERFTVSFVCKIIWLQGTCYNNIILTCSLKSELLCALQAGVDLGQILTDLQNKCQRCKLLGGPGLCWESFWIFNSYKTPAWVSLSFTWDNGQISTRKVFLIIKNISIMKNLTDFCKMVEACVDLCLARWKISQNKHIKLTFYWWYQTAFVLLVLHWFQFCLLPVVFAPEQYLFSYQVCPHPR